MCYRAVAMSADKDMIFDFDFFLKKNYLQTIQIHLKESDLCARTRAQKYTELQNISRKINLQTKV